MKIAIVIPTLDKGGAERVLVHFVNNLDPERDTAIILCLKKAGDLVPFINSNITVVDLDCPRVYFSIGRIRKAVKEYRPDVLIGWMGHVNAVLAFFKPLLPRDLTLMCRESSIPSKFIKHYRAPGLFRFMYRFMNRYDGIICQSMAMKQDLVEHFKVEAGRITVINNPVVASGTLAEISPAAVAFIKTADKMLLFVGRFSAEKQVGLLLELMPGLPPNYKLILVGYGPLDTQVRNKIAERGLAERIMIVGDCNDPTPYYKRADCLLLTSSFEGFPNVLLEANLQGCPVVVYKTKGGAKEIVWPGGGVYIEPEEPGKLSKFAEVTREVCENPLKYNRETIAGKVKDQYEIKKTIANYLGYIRETIKKSQA